MSIPAEKNKYGRIMRVEHENRFNNIFTAWLVSIMVLTYLVNYFGFDITTYRFYQVLTSIFMSIEINSNYTDFQNASRFAWAYSTITGPFVFMYLVWLTKGLCLGQRPKGLLVLIYILGFMGLEKVLLGTFFIGHLSTPESPHLFWSLYTQTIWGHSIFILIYWVLVIFTGLLILGIIKK